MAPTRIQPDPEVESGRASSNMMWVQESVRLSINAGLDKISPSPSVLLMTKKFFSFAMFCLYMGVAMSVVDTVFDIAMVVQYREKKKIGFASATLATIVATASLQIMLLVLNYRKRPKIEMVREIFYVIFLVKPGVDVYRVVSGQKQVARTSMTPHYEMLILRASELGVECIPSAIIQAFAFMDGERSFVLLSSFAMSILTTAFISASLSIDKDVNKLCRTLSPTIYGLVPLKSKQRTLSVCFLIFLTAIIQLLTKVFAFALCYAVSRRILLIYLLVDFSLMFMFKILQGDFYVHTPIYGNPINRIFTSIVSRIVSKLVLDFTLSIVNRHPYEMGGPYYLFTLVSTPFVGVLSGYLYLSHESATASEELFTSEQVYGCFGCFAFLQICVFGCFMSLIDEKYRTTFLGKWKTSREFCVQEFRSDESSERTKINIFRRHVAMWKEIKEEVRAWMNEHLENLLDRNPTWFDKSVRSQILDSFVPPSLLPKLRDTN
ncbi:hypothetical protein TrST_g10104 [Triparma strigata]|uniref:Uncharacterized protein n=1 Tax=Triparma strigata TaxID=1606541 RepID=A0A9W7A2Q3_9STRA|nr:hypothetical protein TrST_g10104 [Triparma strigata]